MPGAGGSPASRARRSDRPELLRDTKALAPHLHPRSPTPSSLRLSAGAEQPRGERERPAGSQGRAAGARGAAALMTRGAEPYAQIPLANEPPYPRCAARRLITVLRLRLQ